MSPPSSSRAFPVMPAVSEAASEPIPAIAATPRTMQREKDAQTAEAAAQLAARKPKRVAP